MELHLQFNEYQKAWGLPDNQLELGTTALMLEQQLTVLFDNQVPGMPELILYLNFLFIS